MAKAILFKSIIFCCLLFSYTVRSQTTITQFVIPAVGDSSILSVDTVMQSEGAFGTNVTWNFSTLQSNYTTKRLYKLPSQTPYDSICLGANLVRTDETGSFYTFWNSSATNLTYFGFVQPGLQSQTYNANPIDYYHFPINYNDTFTDSLTAYTIPGFLTGNGIYSFHADAYGSLQLPNQTFNNTLRVKSIYYIGDSTAGSYSLTTEFAWYDANTKEPLLVIEKVVVDSVLVTSYMLFNNDAPLGIENSLTNAISTNIFPNPVNDKLFIQSAYAPQDIYILNIMGERVQVEQTKNSNDVELNVSTLKSGIYFLILNFKDGTHISKKFIKE